MQLHYLDNAATTRVSESCARAACDAMRTHYGNPSSAHNMGLEAQNLIETARKNVAASLSCAPEEIYFTSGGTESDNWALFSAFESVRRTGGRIISTAAEHPAVLSCLKRLEDLGARVTLLPVRASGDFDMAALSDALTEDTGLVSVMTVNNETGARFPIGEISRAVRAKCGALIHTDAVQAFLKTPLDAGALGADLISLSAHKVGAPKGAGALYARKGVRLRPMLYGGGQQRDMRPGTENVPGWAAFGQACRDHSGRAGENERAFSDLRAYAVKQIGALAPNAVLHLPEQGAAHILSLSLPGIRSQVLMNFLESRGVYVSSGSACSRGKRSHVLTAMGLSPGMIDSAIRISFGFETVREDIDALCLGLRDACDRLL